MDISDKLDTDQDFQSLLKEKQFSTSLQKAIIVQKYQNPTVIQSNLIQISDKKDHVMIQSGFHSGKTVACGIVMLEKFLSKLNTNEPSFLVFLCSSRDICEKNCILMQNLNNFVKKDFKVEVKNIMTIKDSKFNLIENHNYIIFSTPKHFVQFMKVTKISVTQFQGIVIDDLDYCLSFGNFMFQKRMICYKFQYIFSILLKLFNQNVLQTNFFFAGRLFQKFQSNLSIKAQNENNFVIRCFNNEQQFFQNRYGVDLKDIISYLSNQFEKIPIFITCSQSITDEIVNYKKQILTNSATIKIEDEPDKHLKSEVVCNVQQFYYIGDELHRFMVLYMIQKLKFTQGKSIILCKDLDQAYQVNMFFERTKVDNSLIYNVKNPKKQKSYIVSVFNTGLCNIIVSTRELFEDCKTLQIKVQGKRNKVQFKGVQNILLFDFQSLNDSYFNYFAEFRSSGCLISFMDNKETQIQQLSEIIEQQKQSYKKLSIVEFPIKKEEVDAFKYRIQDVWQSISKKQIKSAQMIDFKKQLLKSKELIEYYEKNQTEKQIIQEQIKSAQAMINKYAIRMYDDIPDYLLPQFIKEQRKLYKQPEQSVKKVVKQRMNEDFQKSLVKRLKNNNLTLDDVKKKRKINNDNEKVMYVNTEREDPAISSVETLQHISSRKLWKIKHKKKLHSKNRRMERKGVFQT